MQRLDSVVYRTSSSAPLQVGLLIDEGEGPLLDIKGHPVEEVWEYFYTHQLSLDVSAIFGTQEKEE